MINILASWNDYPPFINMNLGRAGVKRKNSGGWKKKAGIFSCSQALPADRVSHGFPSSLEGAPAPLPAADGCLKCTGAPCGGDLGWLLSGIRACGMTSPANKQPRRQLVMERSSCPGRYLQVLKNRPVYTVLPGWLMSTASLRKIAKIHEKPSRLCKIFNSEIPVLRNYSGK